MATSLGTNPVVIARVHCSFILEPFQDNISVAVRLCLFVLFASDCGLVSHLIVWPLSGAMGGSCPVTVALFIPYLFFCL